MPEGPDTNERAVSLLKRAPDLRAIDTAAAIAPKALEALGPQKDFAPNAPFSLFVPAHQELAVQEAANLMEIANKDGLDAVLQHAEMLADTTSTELAQWALMIFITHHPEGQKLPIPSLEERIPESVKPSSPTPAAPAALEALGASGSEAALDWYREDAQTNAHHERWHVVYPWAGVPNPANPSQRTLKDRQGELFMYMHEQMLARYDCERLCAGLSAPTARLDNFNDPIPEGYKPLLRGYDNREPNADFADSGAPVPELPTWLSNLFGDSGKKNATLKKPNGTTVAANADLLGDSIEANIGSVNDSRYGNAHNMGHVLIAFIPDPNSQDQFGGVMRDPRVAIRDPIFYRWHRQIDEINYQWQEKQDPQNFADAPKVTIRDAVSGTAGDGASPDIAVVQASKVTGDPQQFADTSFGGAKWDTVAADSAIATKTLKTTMKQRTIGGSTVQYLDHEDYFYFIRVNNDTNAELTVTLRIFLVPVEWADQRRQWIELDKFQQKLKAGRNVVARSSKLSVVAKKPATRPGDPVPPREPGADPNYCDCGWPYTLLLPRGTRAGKDFRLLVVATDWSIDKVEVEGKCGSMSFCGKKNVPYPDKRPMGYPFDRHWPAAIAKTILAQKNMAARDIKIQWT
ncbi:MAG: hypothetical protein DMF56_09800 [Acidobacteria bacterium]|nr:MAG: hypothetical protein DMF56_09800 [Acidobacteriota bacterium]